MKIAVAGTGYVGLSIATLLSQHHEVVALDIIEEKVNMINQRLSPIQDREIEDFLKNKDLNLKATLNKEVAFKNAKFVVISTPTNYDEKKNYFDTSSVEDCIESIIKINPEAIMVIKSTIPVGFTETMKAKYAIDNLIFSPEFLGKAGLYTITCIHQELSLEKNQKEQENLQIYCQKVLLKKIFQCYLQIIQKPRRLNCLQIPILH